MKNIPCVITTYDADGVIQHVANTITYWGAKRLVRRMTRVRPDRVYTINEVWNSPMLRSTESRHKDVEAAQEVARYIEWDRRMAEKIHSVSYASKLCRSKHKQHEDSMPITCQMFHKHAGDHEATIAVAVGVYRTIRWSDKEELKVNES